MMKRPLYLVPVLAVLLLASCTTAGLFKKGPAPLNEQFQAVKTYKFGDSRAPLVVIDEQVRTVDPASANADQLRAQLDALLVSDATLDAKRFALRSLALIGQGEDIPVIAPFLLDDDLSDMARYALRPMQDPTVDKVLRKALTKANSSQKIGIINTLGQRGDSAALWAISHQLDNSDEGVRRAGVMALGKLGGPKALATLRENMATASESMRPVYTEACLQAAEGLVASGDYKAAAAAYNDLFNSDEPAHIRMAAFRGLVMSSGSDAGSLIIDQIQGEDPALKQMALVLARQVPGNDFTKALANQLDTIEPDLQLTLLQILGGRGDKVALPQVVKAASSDNDSVRQEALMALGQLGDKSTVALLAKIAANTKGKEQAAARDSLNRLTGPAIDEEIVAELLKTPANQVALRREYIRSLGARQAMTAIPALLKLTSDSQTKVRSEVYKSLALIADSSAVAGLVECIKNIKDSADGALAKDALVAASTRSAADRTANAKVIISQMKGASDMAQASLLKALGSIGDPIALPAIQKALGSQDKDMVDAAVRALADWPTPEPAAQLSQIAKTSPNQTHKVLALRGYVRMAGQTAAQSPAQAVTMYKQALSVVSRPEEKKLILGGLGTVNDPAGFALIESMATDSALRPEAQIAQVKLADQLAIAASGEARKAVNAVLADPATDKLASQARSVLGRIERYDDYISAWQGSGPYTADGVSMNDQLAHKFTPESDPASAKWKTLTPSVNTADRWKVDLKAIYGVDNHAAYLRTNVWSPADQKVRMELGSDDGVKVWVNGQAVIENNVARGLTAASDTVEVNLKKGWNTVMMKISNGGGDWGGALRLRDLNGSHLKGLKIQAER